MRNRLAAGNGNWLQDYTQIFEGAIFEPAKYFFVRVLRLVPRRVPVKRIEHAPLRVFVKSHGNGVGQCPAGKAAGNGNFAQDLMDTVERNHAVTQLVQKPGW